MAVCNVCGGQFDSIGFSRDDAGHNWMLCATEKAPRMRERIAELEAALRKIVYFDSHTVTWRCGYHGDQDVTDEVGHVLTVSK